MDYARLFEQVVVPRGQIDPAAVPEMNRELAALQFKVCEWHDKSCFVLCDTATRDAGTECRSIGWSPEASALCTEIFKEIASGGGFSTHARISALPRRDASAAPATARPRTPDTICELVERKWIEHNQETGLVTFGKRALAQYPDYLSELNDEFKRCSICLNLVVYDRLVEGGETVHAFCHARVNGPGGQ